MVTITFPRSTHILIHLSKLKNLEESPRKICRQPWRKLTDILGDTHRVMLNHLTLYLFIHQMFSEHIL